MYRVKPVGGASPAQPPLLLLYHHAAFLSGRLTPQEHGDTAAHGVFHPRSGALIAQQAGRVADQVVQRHADMLAEEMLRGIGDLFRG